MKSLQHQIWHLLSLGILLYATQYYLGVSDKALDGSLWGIATEVWLWAAIIVPILHQTYVAMCWRAELYHQLLTKAFGTMAFRWYKVGFAILILARPVTLVLLSISSAESLDINTGIAWGLATLLCVPAAYTGYSVKKFFGVDRAFGIDHFEPEWAKSLPFVKEGIFKYTNNAMYLFGFMALWAIALFFRSEAALVVALFSHLYIWVHFAFTEMPDMKEIYGD